MKQQKSAQDRRVDTIFRNLCYCAMLVALLYVPSTTWAGVLVVVLILSLIGGLPAARAVPAFKAVSSDQKTFIEGVLLAGLLAAAILSGLHVALTVVILLAAHFHLRTAKFLSRMRHRETGTYLKVEIVFFIMMLIAASFLTFENGRDRTTGEAGMWFIGLLVLSTATCIATMVSIACGAGRSANAKVTKWIKEVLDKQDIDPSPENVKEFRLIQDPSLLRTERVAAQEKLVNVGVMHAVSGNAVSALASSLAMPFFLVLLGPVVLVALPHYLALWCVHKKIGRPLPVAEFVRGIRVVEPA